MKRRQYLSAAVVAGLGLAGCSDGSGGNNSSNGSSGGTETPGEGAPGTEAATPTETATSVKTQAETSAEMTTAGGTNMSEVGTMTPTGGGGTGTTEVTNTELVVEEGEFSTDVYMTGLVENTGSDVLRLPEVGVSFYNDQNSILNSTTTSIAFLESGTQWEVHEPYFDEGEPARGEIEVASADTFQSELGVPDPLNIAEENLQTGEEPTLSVRVENTSDSAVSPAVFCVFYDGNGIALGDGLDSLEELPAGESWQTTLEYIAYSTQDATRISDYQLYGNLF